MALGYHFDHVTIACSPAMPNSDDRSQPQAAPAPSPSDAGPAHAGGLSTSALLRVQGADAASFLHGQLTHSILDLEGSCFAAYCNAQGRALALFWVLRVSGEEFLLRTHRSLAAAMVARLRLFVLRAKVTIGLAEDMEIAGFMGEDMPLPPGGSLPADVQHPSVGEVLILRRPGSPSRYEVWGARERVARISASGTRPASPESWAWHEVRAGIPELDESLSGEFVPQMLNLDALGAISFTKGCYPGQEIVARTHYLGRLKQRLYLATSSVTVAPGSGLYADNFPNQTAGRVIQAAANPAGGTDLLAVVQIDSARHHPVHVGGPEGPALQFLDLPYPVPGPSA